MSSKEDQMKRYQSEIFSLKANQQNTNICVADDWARYAHGGL